MPKHECRKPLFFLRSCIRWLFKLDALRSPMTCFDAYIYSPVVWTLQSSLILSVYPWKHLTTYAAWLLRFLFINSKSKIVYASEVQPV
ncbi:hypothetical protein BDN70DRAFT_880070 [Pholiota conissans]|uniref:Uncharacterized protein n=1 Tax=Pholiota conissans TaxID=109636 RepID=A0A9P5Z1A4_9AGAR|nr:hypothetical protein BDN70DRAFT_880070 [Pholiota conissans]